MSNPTDTNQASEDKQTKAIYEAMQIPYLSERHDAINALIRTEKLKLLADVRERVVGEDTTYEGHTMNWAIEHHNHLRAEQRAELTKLESEL